MSNETHRALEFWRTILRDTVRAGGPDLSQRQQAMLLAVYQLPGPHTVRGLAADLAISKPAVVRGLDSLEKLGFLRRQRDPDDGRNILIQRSVKGAVFLSDMAERIVQTQIEINQRQEAGGNGDER